MTTVVTDAEVFRAACNALRAAGERVGFVATMGALHEGHLSLVEAVKARGCTPVVSIFVNPTQFGDAADLELYPRDLDADVALCRQHGVGLVFAPAVSQVYPRGDSTRVRVEGVSAGLCGAARPGHFEGVATVVTKLLALVGPCTAAFGQKDYQQLMVIRRLVRDLLLPVEVVGVPIAREADGLARSSRNTRLSRQERVAALGIPRGLAKAQALFDSGERHAQALVSCVVNALDSSGLQRDYVELVEPDTLAGIGPDCPEHALLAVAAWAGSVRLIDNRILGAAAPASPLGSRGGRHGD